MLRSSSNCSPLRRTCVATVEPARVGPRQPEAALHGRHLRHVVAFDRRRRHRAAEVARREHHLAAGGERAATARVDFELHAGGADGIGVLPLPGDLRRGRDSVMLAIAPSGC